MNPQNQIDHNYLGDSLKGEIEIIDDPESIRSLLEKRQDLPANHNITSDGLGSVFEDEYIVVKRDPVRFPNGTIGNYLRVIEKPSLSGGTGVVMLPIRGEEVFLIRTFRHPLRSWEIELPRGYRAPESTAEDAVKTEISEEIGLEVDEIIELGFINPNSGILASTVQAFWVKVRDGAAKPDENDSEAIESVLTVTIKDLTKMISEGKIRDSFTLATFQLAQAKGLI